MPAVSKNVLKAKMLEYFRQVEDTGEELVVTDRGRPVLRVVPIRTFESPDAVFADVRGAARLPEDALALPLGADAWADSLRSRGATMLAS
jgi:prevent-host-death family protein